MALLIGIVVRRDGVIDRVAIVRARREGVRVSLVTHVSAVDVHNRWVRGRLTAGRIAGVGEVVITRDWDVRVVGGGTSRIIVELPRPGYVLALLETGDGGGVTSLDWADDGVVVLDRGRIGDRSCSATRD